MTQKVIYHSFMDDIYMYTEKKVGERRLYTH